MICHFALVCGCNYNGGWTTYQSYNDAVKFYKLLIDKFNFSSECIKVLYNQQYTRNNILHEMKWLASQLINENCIGVVYNASHGVQSRDYNGDEKDGYDENIQTYEHSRVCDDEITDIFKNIHPKARLTFISDSCHSGTLLDNIENEINYNWCSIASSLDNEASIQCGDGGVLSLNLFSILDESGTNITYDELRVILEKKIKKSFIGDLQHPLVLMSNEDIKNKKIFT